MGCACSKNRKWWAVSWLLKLTLAGLALASVVAQAEEAARPQRDVLAERGYRLLTTTPYLPPDFDQQTFDELWRCWEPAARERAEKASPAERRRMAFQRYGLVDNPDRPGGVALQYVDDGHGNWVMNCLACHQGTVAGRVIPGVANSQFDLQTLIEEVRTTKLRAGKPLAHLDRASLLMPLGGSIGTTNAVMFGKFLLAYRDRELVVHKDRPRPELVNHDHDAPAWWLLKRKTHLYCDGFAPKGHRALMQFLLIPSNGPDRFRSWENDYRAILAWIESLEAPPWPGTVDRSLAERGKVAFERVCAECHGTYGSNGHWPEKIVPLDVVGTDPVRLRSLGLEGRKRYAASWFTGDTELPTIVEPAGYVAPPLDGVWATAPYLHNGSVPTLWHILHPDDRPRIWRRTADGYDESKVGLEVTAYEKMPDGLSGASPRRQVFDSRLPSKSAAGHRVADELDESERSAVLEYLKTL